jgi:hypothetical protein
MQKHPSNRQCLCEFQSGRDNFEGAGCLEHGMLVFVPVGAFPAMEHLARTPRKKSPSARQALLELELVSRDCRIPVLRNAVEDVLGQPEQFIRSWLNARHRRLEQAGNNRHGPVGRRLQNAIDERFAGIGNRFFWWGRVEWKHFTFRRATSCFVLSSLLTSQRVIV